MWVDRTEDWCAAEEGVVNFSETDAVYQRGIVYYLRGDKVRLFLLSYSTWCSPTDSVTSGGGGGGGG